MSPALVSPEHGDREEMVTVLHEEIDRLPERCRVLVVLCDLQGLSHEKAARHLGWPVGTVKSRLARAREMLRGRLSRRGQGLPAGRPVANGLGLALPFDRSRLCCRVIWLIPRFVPRLRSRRAKRSRSVTSRRVSPP